MNLKLLKFSIFIIFFALFSCKHKVAPIENHAGQYYKNKKSYIQKYLNENYKQNRGKSVVFSGSRPSKIKVENGETLYGIAQKYNVKSRDIIQENNLIAPYNLQAGQILRLPKAKYHQVQNGETLYSIARYYNMNVSELVEINDLNAPYQIYSGQKLKITATVRAAQNNTSQPKSAKATKSEYVKLNKPTFVGKLFSGSNVNFAWPVKAPIVSKFGPKSGGLYNDGINLKTSAGQDIRAAESGVVAYVGNELKGYGNLIIIKHPKGYITAYGHLQQAMVERGAKVEKSQIIAKSGSSGNVSYPQLYFAIRKGKEALNPENYLK